MLLNRRKTLTLLSSAPLLVAPNITLSQGFGRQPLPDWVQFNRRRGRSWQNQRTQTIRLDKGGRYIQGAEWDNKNKKLLRLFYFDDPQLKLQNEIYKMYEVRPEEDLDSNPSQVEDMAWPRRTTLNERIWTSFYPPADSLWEDIFDPENPNHEPVEVPTNALYLWTFPTNDEPPEETDAHIDLKDDHLLSNTIKAMLEKEIAIAGVPRSAGNLYENIEGSPFGNIYMAQMPPGSKQHRYVYFMILAPIITQ